MKTKKTMSREEWASLRYRVEIQALADDEGGGWIAWIPDLGKGMFMVDGETAADTLAALEAHRLAMYDRVIASGAPIPLPDDVTDRPEASGKWLQRTGKRLHAELKAAAEADGVSFNSYCESCLTRGHLMYQAGAAMQGLAQGLCEDFRMRVGVEVKRAQYQFSGLQAEASGPSTEQYNVAFLGGSDEQKAS